MTSQTAPSTPKAQLNWSTILARVRSISGFILFAYVLVHFSNHAVGLYSQDALDQVGRVIKTFWRFPPIAVLLYGALAAHVAAVLINILLRRSLRLTPREALQAVMGIAIPALMVTHVMGTSYASAAYGINDSYEYVLLSTFVFSPVNAYLNAAGLVAAWIHGCIGFHMWARFRSWYTQGLHQWAIAFAMALPLLSLAGYLSAGRRITPLASDGEFLEGYYQRLQLATDDIWGWLARDTQTVTWVAVGTFASVAVIRLLLPLFRKREKTLTVRYLDGPEVQQPVGLSLLEMSKAAGVPHASVCGGRGRCSTCRVQVLDTGTALPPPDDGEKRVLDRIDAPDNVRLACQVWPQSDIRIMRLLPADNPSQEAGKIQSYSTGSERLVTVMFADLRDFTKTSENRLPFDVVYLINQFSSSMGMAVESNGGRIDKFLGDGLMALFGVDGSARDGARQSLAAAGAMLAELQILNERLEGDLEKPLRMGIGVHSGTAIIGEMGYGHARGLTAIGDTVNVASRLEAATKELQCALCVSEDVVRIAEIEAAPDAARQLAVRGKRSKVNIFGVDHPDFLDPQAVYRAGN